MPQLVINRQYADGTVLTAAQLDAAYASITTLVNITGLGSDNLQDNSVGSAEIQTSGVSNLNLATNSVSTNKIIDGNVTLSKLDPIGVQTFLVPTGVSLDYCTSTPVAPAGYLLCNGAAVSRTVYSALFAILGTIYGTGDGSTTFNLPDASDRHFRHIGTLAGEFAFAKNGGTAAMYQDDAIHDHAHVGTIATTVGTASSPTGTVAIGSATGPVNLSANIPAVIAFNGSGGHSGLSSTETRGKAFLGYKIIKY